MLKSRRSIAIPPGETIKELLDSRGMSQKEFAIRMDMSEKHISHLLNGKVELTMDASLKLELVLGVPASVWLNLETNYREKLARVKNELEMESEQEISKKMPYTKMASLGWVSHTKDSLERVKNLRAFFEVTKLELLDKLKIPGIAYRGDEKSDASNYIKAAWAQRAKILAREDEVFSFNRKMLENKIYEIRDLTLLTDTHAFTSAKAILGSCGIALVVLPHIERSFVQGASFRDGNKVVLAMSVRGKSADIFWFSLFHELYHILEGHINSFGSTSEKEEQEADCFARDILIGPNEYENFLRKNSFSRKDIQRFSNEIYVSEGIVVGRLQKDGIINYSSFNDLKEPWSVVQT